MEETGNPFFDMVLRIGTRGSKLALVQSQWVKARIEATHADIRVELVTIKTTGDTILDSPLSKLGGKGLFVKEIEEALLQGEIHLAVHSMKDVPALLPEPLTLTAYPEREDPRDGMISLHYPSLGQLPEGARVGTSSLRRSSQVLQRRPDLCMETLRGNVDTRLRRLDEGKYDAIILAVAGLNRFGLSHRITEVIPTSWMLPAVGQGALGIEVRREDCETRRHLDFLDHEPTREAVLAERAFLKELEGGCQVPIGALAVLEGDDLRLEGMVGELDGSKVIRKTLRGDRRKAEEIGVALAKAILSAGGKRILAGIYDRAG
jgi:hydroxymethylbilane synthase